MNVETCINLFFSDIFFTFLVNQINKIICRQNTEINNAESKNSIKSMQRSKKPITMVSVCEVKSFIGLFLYFGILKLPEIKDYWSNNTKAY